MELESYPSKVRGLGNVILPKKEQEYITHESIVTQKTEEYDGWKINEMKLSSHPTLIKLNKSEFDERDTIMVISAYRKHENEWVEYPGANAVLSIEGLDEINLVFDAQGKYELNLEDLELGPAEYLEFYIKLIGDSNNDLKYIHGWLIIKIICEYTQNNNILVFKVDNDPLYKVRVTLYNSDDEIKEIYFSNEEGVVEMEDYQVTDTFEITKEGYVFIKKEE